MGFDKLALFADLGYQPHAGQLAIHRSNARYRVVACGVRWGKTTAAAMEGVAAAIAPAERSIGWICAPTYDLADRVFREIEVIVLERLRHRLIAKKEAERRILLRNLAGGVSEIRAKSADNPVSLLGEGLDWLVVDEAARLKPTIWQAHLSQRLIDKRGWALFLSTPRGRDFFWKLFRRGQNGRDKDFESWSSPSWQNPLLDRSLIDDERCRLTADAFASQYGGEFTGEDPEPCDVCHGPSPDAPGVTLLEGDEELGRCAECGQSVDASGRTVVKRHSNGNRSVMVIRLQSRAGEQPQPRFGSLLQAAKGIQIASPERSSLELDP